MSVTLWLFTSGQKFPVYDGLEAFPGELMDKKENSGTFTSKKKLEWQQSLDVCLCVNYD